MDGRFLGSYYTLDTMSWILFVSFVVFEKTSKDKEAETLKKSAMNLWLITSNRLNYNATVFQQDSKLLIFLIDHLSLQLIFMT